MTEDFALMDYLFTGVTPGDVDEKVRVLTTAKLYQRRGHEVQVLAATPTRDEVWVSLPPVPSRKQIVRDFHVSHCHMGMGKLRGTLREWYWWPGMAATIVEIVSMCATCQMDKAAPQAERAPLPAYKGTRRF